MNPADKSSNEVLTISAEVENISASPGEVQLSLKWAFANQTDKDLYILFESPYTFQFSDPGHVIIDHSAQPALWENQRSNVALSAALLHLKAGESQNKEFPYNLSISPAWKTIGLVGKFGIGEVPPPNFAAMAPNWTKLEAWQTVFESNAIRINIPIQE